MVLEIFLCSVSTLVLSTTKWDVIRKKFKNVNNSRILHNWEVRMVCGSHEREDQIGYHLESFSEI